MLIDLVDKLADRLIQLVNHKRALRREHLDQFVTPTFEAFNAVHAHYLSSFARYREILKSVEGPLGPSHSLLDLIRTDNLFTQHQRERILQLGAIAHEGEDGEDGAPVPFMRLIRDYLVDTRVAEDPIAGYRVGRFNNPQHWRRSLLRELDALFDDNWQVILDPNSSQPPLYDAELEEALAEKCREYGIDPKGPRHLDELKAALAVKALDAVVADMQDAYSQVANEYERLRVALSK
jgi:hypothetical protein